MDARERVEAALALDVADRPPVGAWGHDFIAEWSPAELAGATVAAQGKFGWDFIKFQPRASCFSEAFGAEWKPSGERLKDPIQVKPAVTDPEELAQIGGPANRAAFDDQNVSLAKVVAEVGRRLPVIQTVFSPLTVVDYLLGRQPGLLLHELGERPHLILRAMNRVADALIDFSNEAISAGASGVFFAISGFASRDSIPLSDYRDAVLRYDQKVLGALDSRAWFNVLHICGANIHFELASELPAHAISWSIHDAGNPSLEDGIKMSGRPAMGGLGQKSTLLNGSPDEIADETRAAAGANGGRGILIAPGCSVPPAVSQESLLTASQTVGAD
jgi:uroporphyrinogen decarboxylase